MKILPMLDIVDCSRGFMVPGNILYVPGSEKTVEPIHNFLKKTEFSYALLKNDTHFEGEYKHSPEEAIFDFHQGFGTEEHEYLVDENAINASGVYWILKNKFDMWAENSDVGVPLEQIEFASDEEKEVYQNLFHLALRVDGQYHFFDHRDEFISDIQKMGVEEAVVFGHASDYCVRDAIIGYLERGFKVYWITDLCCGIWDTNLPGGVASLTELVERCPGFDTNGNVVERSILKDAVASGQLVLTTAQAYIDQQ